mgnify:CR=1 FL=1
MTGKRHKEESAGKPSKSAGTTKSNDNAVLMGQKPVMNYVIACLTFFNSAAKEVAVKARGGQSAERSMRLNC